MNHESTGVEDILRARVNQQCREAARVATVPQTESEIMSGWFVADICVKNRDVAQAFGWISGALPRTPSVSFYNFSLATTGDETFDVADGEDAEVLTQVERQQTPLDLQDCLVNFYWLRRLIFNRVGLNGRYPFLFQFQHLEELQLVREDRLKWDLDDLEQLLNLKKLRVVGTHCTGHIHSLRKLYGTLEEIDLAQCERFEGSIHDLADFPRLQVLSLVPNNPLVTGVIRNIGPDDFVSIRRLELGEGVYGGSEMASIRDAEGLMAVRYLLKKRCSSLFANRRWRLSEESPEFYHFRDNFSREPPFWIEFVEAGRRMGWRWTNAVSGGSCETNWLDP